MTLSAHVVSLPLAQRMKAAGFVQETCCMWSHRSATGWDIVQHKGDCATEWCAAPLASEVMEKMGDTCVLERFGEDGSYQAVDYHRNLTEVGYAQTAADALALLWLALNEK
jgi:hypothetical protein